MNFAILQLTLAATVMVIAAPFGHAMSLGQARGDVLIGRPLDVIIPVRFDTGDDPASLCAQAEIQYADTPVSTSRIVVRTSPGPESSQVLVRVTTSAVVDEPVVAVVVRVGCAVKNTRRYVLLADLPSQATERLLAVPSLVVTPPNTERQSEKQSTGGGNKPARADGLTGESASPNRTSRVPTQSATGASTSRSTAKPDGATARQSDSQVQTRTNAGSGLAMSPRLNAARPSKPGQSRLQLEPADWLVAPASGLKFSSELARLPAENEPRRTEFAALWRALNLQPEDVMRNDQSLAQLQAETRILREGQMRTQNELTLARQQLELAQVERYRNPLVYGLAVLLGMLVLAVGYGWFQGRAKSRSSGSPAWWALRSASDGATKHKRGSVNLETLDAAWQHESLPSIQSALLVEPFDSAVSPGSTTTSLTAKPRSPESSFLPSTFQSGPRGVNVNELFDIAQQADFFVSLGQHDLAIEALLNHIRDNEQTSPLAYLDLFKIYHDVGRRSEYSGLRAEFSRIFNAEVPLFDAFRESGQGLETYADTISRLQTSWGTPAVLDVIEESLFRKPESAVESYGLEAYRELLLLYAIINELMQPLQDKVALKEATGFARLSVTDDTWVGRVSNAPLKEVSVPKVYRPSGIDASITQGSRGGQNFVPSTPGNNNSRQPTRSGVGLDIDLANPLVGLPSLNMDTVPAALQIEQPRQPGSSTSSGWLEFEIGELGVSLAEEKKI